MRMFCPPNVPLTLLSLFAGALFANGAQAGPPIEVELVVVEGQDIPSMAGVSVTGVGAPFTNSTGQVGLVVTVDDLGSTDRVIWFDAGSIFRGTDASPDVLSGGESTMGIGDGGEFIYSPSINGGDGVWNQSGLIVRDDDPAPDFPGEFITFASRPQMTPDGTAYFVAGRTDTQGGSTQNRVLYRSSGGTTTKILTSGDMIGGLPIRSGGGVEFSYDISENGLHHIQELTLDTGSTATDNFVYIDGVASFQEGTPTGDGDNWDNIDVVSINDSGESLFSGDTDGDTSSDEFLAVNGTIAIREGQTVDGVLLQSAAVNAASLNNLGQIAHIWGVSGGEHLFVGDATNLLTSSRRIVSVGEQIDVDDDGLADYEITDFNASNVIGPGLCFSDDCFVYVEVDVDDLLALVNLEAILKITVPTGGSRGNVNEQSGTIQSVLLVDGSDGGTTGTATVSLNTTFTVSLDASTGGPLANARYILWVWPGKGSNPTSLDAAGSPVGTLVNPIPPTGASPQPIFCVPGSGIPGVACGALSVVSGPSFAPWSLMTQRSVPSTLTLQGLLEDDSTSHPTGFSVTNAMTLVIE